MRSAANEIHGVEYLRTARASLSRHIGSLGATNLVLLLILAAILFIPLFSVGITTNDDAMLGIDYGERDFWAHARGFSIGQGRFSFWWQYPLFQLPYLFEGRAWYLTLKYGAFVLLLFALYYALVEIFESTWIGLTSLVLFLAFIQNGWDHNVLTSYPFVYNFLATLFLLSLGLFAQAVCRRRLVLAYIAAVLYFFALASEFFVLFFPIYLVLAVAKAAPGQTLKSRLVAARPYLIAISGGLVAYLSIYLMWRSAYPSIYPGNRLYGSDLLATAKVIALYSLSAFPLASLHFFVSPEQQLRFADSAGLGTILAGLNTVHFIKPAVTGLLIARLMTSASFVLPSTRKLVVGAALAMIAIFLPNVLLGFTEKYQGWVASGSHSYLYTYHSFIAAVTLGALLLAYLTGRSRSWNRGLRLGLLLAVTIGSMALSFAVEVRNQYVALDQKLSHRKWELMDALIGSPSFAEIPNGATIVTPTLLEHYRGIAFAPADYWSKYVWYKTGKSVKFVNDRCADAAPCYGLVLRQEKHSDNQLIAVGKLRRDDRSSEASALTVYALPSRPGAVLIGSFTPQEAVPGLYIDGQPIGEVDPRTGLFAAKLPSVVTARAAQVARIEGNVDLVAEGINFLQYGIQPRLRPFAEELAQGIDFRRQDYPDLLIEVSGLSGYEGWGRWTDATSSPAATFTFRRSLPARFELEITAGAFAPNIGKPVSVTAAGVTKTFIIAKAAPDVYRLRFDTDGTARTLAMTPSKPASPNDMDPRNPDMRKLGISLTSFRIRPIAAAD